MVVAHYFELAVSEETLLQYAVGISILTVVILEINIHRVVRVRCNEQDSFRRRPKVENNTTSPTPSVLLADSEVTLRHILRL